MIDQLEIDNCIAPDRTGELRSYNNKHGEGSRLVISVLAKQLMFTDEEDKNTVLLSGACVNDRTCGKRRWGDRSVT